MSAGFLRHAIWGVVGLVMVATVSFAAPAGAKDVPSPAAPPLPVIRYGAIAYAPEGVGGKAWDQGSRARAETAALAQCGLDTCNVLTSFTRCGAVAHDGSNLQGGSGSSRAAAEADAMSRLGGGEALSWACNRMGPPRSG